jgi:hypothetical protein
MTTIKIIIAFWLHSALTHCKALAAQSSPAASKHARHTIPTVVSQVVLALTAGFRVVLSGCFHKEMRFTMSMMVPTGKLSNPGDDRTRAKLKTANCKHAPRNSSASCCSAATRRLQTFSQLMHLFVMVTASNTLDFSTSKCLIDCIQHDVQTHLFRRLLTAALRPGNSCSSDNMSSSTAATMSSLVSTGIDKTSE